MGEFRAGQWIICLLIYFLVYFLLVLGIVNLRAAIYTNDQTITFTDPGFMQLSLYTAYGGKCTSPGNMDTYIGITFQKKLSCSQLISDNESCNLINNCTWVNETNVYGITVLPARCTGDINNPSYGITGIFSSYCDAPGLQNETLCGMFKCNWLNSSEIITAESFKADVTSAYKGASMLWETAKIMLGFNTNFGFKSFGWLFSIFFSYIEILMLVYAIYKVIPFT